MTEQLAIISYDDGREDVFTGNYVNTPHCASVLVDDGIYNDERLEEALHKTFQVCLYLHIAIHQHFRRMYVHDAAGSLQYDWALSDLALYLLLLNGDPHNEHVAFAKSYAIRRAFYK